MVAKMNIRYLKKFLVVSVALLSTFYCSKNFDNTFASLSSEDSTWLEDYDGNGVADSIEKHAPDCNKSLNECFEIARENFEKKYVWLLDENENGIPDSLENYLVDCDLTATECIAVARDSIKPAFSLDEGTYTSSQILEIKNATVSGEIRYTLNGKDPDTSSLLYEKGITLDVSQTIKAALFINGVMTSEINQITVTITGVSSPPVFTPPAGDYSDTLYVRLSTDDSETFIRYTLDGSEPSDFNNAYKDSLIVGKTLTIKAITFTPGLGASEIVEAKYRLVVGEPVANIDAGIFDTAQVVTLSNNTPLSTIRYTLDGSDPSESSEQYLTPIEFESSTRIKSQAYRPEWTTSSVLNRWYQIQIPGEVNSPIFNPAPGTYISQVDIDLSTTSDSTQIYYTIDEAEPDSESTVYSDTIPLTVSTVIKAVAYNANGDSSAVTTGAYIIKVDTPSVSVPGGIYSEGQSVTLSSNTLGADVYFTINGSEPDSNSTKYTAAISLPSSVTLKAISLKSGCEASDILEVSYEINITGAVATPAFGPAPGTYLGGGFYIIIGSNTVDATIYYTTDGSPPDDRDLEFNSPIQVLETTVFNAIAYKEGLDPSAVRTASYTIQVAPVAFSPVGGQYFEAQSVSLSSLPADATIRYTLDGSTPTESSGLIYTDPINVSDTLTINAIGYKDGLTSSGVYSATYSIELNVVEQTINLLSPVGGEQWIVGTTERVSWSTDGNVTSVTLQYSPDGGASWHSIIGSTPADAGFYDWVIPDNPTLQALVLASVTEGLATSQSLGVFEIKSPAQSSVWGYYPFNGNSQDESGNGHDATANSFPALTSDKNGNSSSAYELDGINDYFYVWETDVPSTQSATTGFSVTLWINPFYLNRDAVLIDNSANNSSGYFISLLGDRLYFEINQVNELRANARFESALNWYHIAATYDGTSMCIYLNALPTCEQVFAKPSPSEQSIIFGMRENSFLQGSGFFRGILDEITLYTRSLSPSEISSLYKGPGGTMSLFKASP